jgi:hypothetical protein
MPRYTAVLDACVLVPIALADTLLRVAEKGLYRPLWSMRILAAAAARGGAQGIITANVKDFPATALEPLGLEAVHPDDFLLDERGREVIRQLQDHYGLRAAREAQQAREQRASTSLDRPERTSTASRPNKHLTNR